MIYTHSKFYYVDAVTASNLYLDFDEGGSEINASLRVGAYTLTELAAEIADRLTFYGTQTYTCVVDRDDRTFTISASSNFTLRVTTGANASSSIYSVIGLTSNQTGSNSYTTGAVGSSYVTQFMLQDYVDGEDNRSLSQASVNVAASGINEVLSFGDDINFQMNFRYINNYPQVSDSPIRNNATGVEEFRLLMRHCIKRYPIEFIADEDNTSTYKKLIFQGTSYKLEERYGDGLAGYYDSGKLTFREIV